MIFVKLKEITHFKAQEKYVIICCDNGSEYLIEQSLVSLETELPSAFRRIHFSIIINTEHIRIVESYFNSRYRFTLNDRLQQVLTSGRSYQQTIKEWIDAGFL
ncbi:LytTR family DNA-binding domain-containing protein [Robertkochia solimangrovi]|uniref:LytTR family DNA-binding domain-containing protein n=1 Tax=Robertkochia solimangrovi TaxID=2213046 RepID=UPI00117FFDF2|nr:hypothetical protein DMZ48_14680 [Robertkochia solimangrovi]